MAPVALDLTDADSVRGPVGRPVGRLAPSPTGLLHLGHARSFLAAWWQARHAGGLVVLRVEDLDPARSRTEYVDALLRDLEWLGLDWDGALLLQSTRDEAYREALRVLRERGELYPCVCTRAELQALPSAPHLEDGTPRYPGTCRGRFQDLEDARRGSGREAAWRWTVPEGEVRWVDGWAGPRTEDVAATIGDLPLTTRNGDVGYQLAVVVDDAHQGVTDVVRGDDLLPSAARQALLREALGLPRPRTAHVGLVTDAGGRRLAKRRADLALASLREAGVPAGRVLGWALESLGGRSPVPWRTPAARELNGAADLLSAFDPRRVPRGPIPVPPDLLQEGGGDVGEPRDGTV